jgi:MFS family permease
VPQLAARFGSVRFLAACYLIAAFSLIAFRAVDSVVLWFVLRFTLNCGLQGLFVVSEVWINQVSTDQSRGRAIAIYASLLSTGFFIGPMTLQIVGTEGWIPFLAASFFILAALIPLLLARKLVPPVDHAPATAMTTFLFKSPSASFAALAFGALETCLFSFLPVYMVRLGSTEKDGTLLLAAWALGNMLLQPPLGWLADRIDKRLVLMGCGLVGVGGAILMPMIASTNWLALALIFVWGGTVLGLYMVGLAHLGSRFRGSDLAAANAGYAFLYAFGSFAGPGIGGAAMDNLWNPQGLMIALGLISAAYVAIAGWRYAASKRVSAAA